jgi:hypothetical protein
LKKLKDSFSIKLISLQLKIKKPPIGGSLENGQPEADQTGKSTIKNCSDFVCCFDFLLSDLILISNYEITISKVGNF